MNATADYLRWHWLQVGSGDLDPMYPVLRRISERWGLDPDQRAWLAICHVIWYHPGSTLQGFRAAPEPGAIPEDLTGSVLLKLPCLTERRGHRPKQPLINHLQDLRSKLQGGVLDWVTQPLEGDDPQLDWARLNEHLMTIVGNGRWAAYKTAELLQKVCGLPVEAADAGHRYSSGPRKGLQVLEPDCPQGNTPEDIARLDQMTQQYADLLGEPDLAQVETSLCDFNSLVNGRYYLGHDIDSMQDAWRAVPAPADAWEARADIFDPQYLGELNDWNGVRKPLKRLYQRTGELTW